MEVSATDTPAATSSKTKHAAMKIYKPPSLRDSEENSSGGTGPKLNVFAKEFVMNNATVKNTENCPKVNIVKNEAKDKFSPENVSISNENVTLSFLKSDSSQNTKSSNYRHPPSSFSSSTNNFKYGLLRAKSIGDVLTNSHVVDSSNTPKIQFRISVPDSNTGQTNKWSLNKEKKIPVLEHQMSGNLKRSKSLSSTDMLKRSDLNISSFEYSTTFNEYHMFPEKMQDSIRQAVKNVNLMTDKNKIILARFVVKHAVTNEKYASPVAKLSIIVIETDKNGAYLDSLVNTCQMFYQMKEVSISNHLLEFLCFLTQMYIELKRSKLQIKLLSDPIIAPKITILTLISHCCEDILIQNGRHSLPEIECLYATLTTVGQDIEWELPATFKELFASIREVFLRNIGGPQIQKILLQLIELRAARWQLPISILNYYYSKMPIKSID